MLDLAKQMKELNYKLQISLEQWVELKRKREKDTEELLHSIALARQGQTILQKKVKEFTDIANSLLNTLDEFKV